MNKKINKKLESIGMATGRDFWFYFLPLMMATLFLAGTAAYFSVYGLSKVFAGAKTPAIIMASAIEFGKIVAVSFTNRYWNAIGKIKWYLVVAITIAMIVTSASIFGFLSDAYQKTASELDSVNAKVKVEESRKTYINQQITSYNSQIELKEKRINNLSEIRSTQETRLDSLYNKGWYNSAKRTEKLITDANDEIIKLTSEISQLSSGIATLNDSINTIDMRILDHNSTDVSAELGPIIFVTNLLDADMGKVVVVFIFMLIFVFDPMAMSLVIAMNKLLDIRSGKDEEYTEPIKPEITVTEEIPAEIVQVEENQDDIDKRFEEINNKTNGGLKIKPQILNSDANNRE